MVAYLWQCYLHVVFTGKVELLRVCSTIQWCCVEAGFWRDGTNRDSVGKTETGRDGIRDNAKLNSLLKILKKS